VSGPRPKATILKLIRVESKAMPSGSSPICGMLYGPTQLMGPFDDAVSV